MNTTLYDVVLSYVKLDLKSKLTRKYNKQLKRKLKDIDPEFHKIYEQNYVTLMVTNSQTEDVYLDLIEDIIDFILQHLSVIVNIQSLNSPTGKGLILQTMAMNTNNSSTTCFNVNSYDVSAKSAKLKVPLEVPLSTNTSSKLATYVKQQYCDLVVNMLTATTDYNHITLPSGVTQCDVLMKEITDICKEIAMCTHRPRENFVIADFTSLKQLVQLDLVVFTDYYKDGDIGVVGYFKEIPAVKLFVVNKFQDIDNNGDITTLYVGYNNRSISFDGPATLHPYHIFKSAGQVVSVDNPRDLYDMFMCRFATNNDYNLHQVQKLTVTVVP